MKQNSSGRSGRNRIKVRCQFTPSGGLPAFSHTTTRTQQMKINRFTLSLAGIAALVSMAVGQVSNAADKASDCNKEAKKVSASVTDKPENVLKIVAKEVQESPTCVGEIVKAAITA